jgi:hypothetical protein
LHIGLTITTIYDKIYNLHILIQTHKPATGTGYVLARNKGGGVAGDEAGVAGRDVFEGEQTAIYEEP